MRRVRVGPAACSFLSACNGGCIVFLEVLMSYIVSLGEAGLTGLLGGTDCTRVEISRAK